MTSPITEILDKIPGWGVLLACLLTTFLSTEVGFHIGKARRRQVEEKERERMRPGPFTASVLGLLAFMLAIIYGGVESRTLSLKQGSLEEANAISTVYRRADLLPSAHRAEIHGMLRQYVDQRLEMAQEGAGKRTEQLLASLEEIQRRLWSRTVALAQEESTALDPYFVSSVSRLLDITTKKLMTAIHYRVPGTLWVVLYGLAVLGMGLGGYTSGISGSRRLSVISLVSAAAYSVVFMLVVTQDRPLHAAQVSKAAMVALHARIESFDEHAP